MATLLFKNVTYIYYKVLKPLKENLSILRGKINFFLVEDTDAILGCVYLGEYEVRKECY